MKLISVILFVSFGFINQIYSQAIHPSEKFIEKIFKLISTHNQLQNKNSSNPSQNIATSFYINDDDSAFYKKDTLLLFSSEKHFYQFYKSICQTVEIQFHKDKSIGITKTNLCTEPSIGRTEAMVIAKGSVTPNYKLKNNDSKTTITIKRYQKPDEEYIVYNIELQALNLTELSFIFTLIRIN